MESKVKKATIRINKIIKKYDFQYLLSICSDRYLLVGPYSHQELIYAEKDLTHQIKNRLTLLYKIFGKDLLSIWNCPILTNNEFDNLPSIKKIDLMHHYSNSISEVLQKIYNEFTKQNSK